MSGEKKTITVAGVTFSADEVVCATLKIEGREIDIGEKQDDNFGFRSKKNGD